MKKLILLFSTVVLGLTSYAQVYLQTNNHFCYPAPDPGDSSIVHLIMKMGGNNDSITSGEFKLVTANTFVFDTAVVLDTNYSDAVLLINPDTLYFYWSTPDTPRIVSAMNDLLDITIKTQVAMFDSLSVAYTHFLNQDSVPISCYSNTLDLYPEPKIIKQPTDTSACIGETARFFLAAEGYGVSINYRWQEYNFSGAYWFNLINNPPLSGASTDTLQINPVMPPYDGKLYHCIVDNNVCPIVTSDSVTLTVNYNIQTHPADQSIYEGDTASFVVVPHTINPQYLWEVSDDGGLSWSSTEWFPAITTPALTIINTPLAWDHFRFRCIVQGICPTDTSNTAILHVLPNIGMEQYASAVGSIYPNPMTTSAVYSPGFEEEYFTILFDPSGKIVRQTAAVRGPMTIQKGSLSAGTYYLGIYRPATGAFSRIPLVIQ